MAAWGYEFYFLVLKVSLQRSKIKFVSPRSHVIYFRVLLSLFSRLEIFV